MKQMVWSAATIWVSTRSTAVFVGVYKSPGAWYCGAGTTSATLATTKISLFHGIVTAERLVPFEKRLQHCFSKNQRLTPILPKSGGQGQVFKKSEVKANSSKNRRLRPIRSKTVRKHLRFGGSKAAVKQLGAQTQPRRN
jgi:hypothetical protein